MLIFEYTKYKMAVGFEVNKNERIQTIMSLISLPGNQILSVAAEKENWCVDSIQKHITWPLNIYIYFFQTQIPKKKSIIAVTHLVRPHHVKKNCYTRISFH